VIERLAKGAVDFDELVRLAGGEKLPGCGAIVPFSVGSRPKAKNNQPKLLDEATAARRLRLLNNLHYYFRARTGEKKNGRERGGVKRTWPGLPKALVTMSPGDSRALIDAVTAGAMTPAQLQQHLATLSKELRDAFRKATAFGGKRGLEAEFCVWHLEQGCLHCHLYFRDIDVTDPKRSRLGLWGRTSKGKEISRERLTLNGLGRTGVAMWRHREAGHQPKTHVFKKTGKVVRDWALLESSLESRAAKGLGECWDVVLSKHVDRFWAGVFATPGLKKHHENGHEAWAKDWVEKCTASLKALEEQASQILQPVLEEKEKEKRAERRNTALAAGGQIADWRDALRTVMRGGEPPQRFSHFFKKHASGRWQLNAGTGSAERVVELLKPTDTSVAVAKDFLSLAKRQSEALDRYVDLYMEQDEAAAEAFLAGEEAKWKVSIPQPQPSAEELKAELAALQKAKAKLEAEVARVEAEKEELVEKLAEATPVWQEWSSMRLHEAIERVAMGVSKGEDEFLLDHHGRISPQVRDRLTSFLHSPVPREQADARSALDILSVHDARVRKRLFEENGFSQDGKRPEDDEGEKWKRSEG
jgi:hypothetical protein